MTGDTSSETNDFSYGSGECAGVTSGWGAGSNDYDYLFAAPTTGPFTVVLDATIDSTLYATTTCGDSSTCLAGQDLIGTTPETLSLSLVEGEEVFIYVDGYSNSSSLDGAYTLTIEEPCVPSCEGAVCGDDGCGGSCGMHFRGNVLARGQ